MRTFHIVPYGKDKRPVSFLRAFLLRRKKLVRIKEAIGKRWKAIGDVHIDVDGIGRDCFWVTIDDSFYDNFVEVLKNHNFPGKYRGMYGISLNFLLREIE